MLSPGFPSVSIPRLASARTPIGTDVSAVPCPGGDSSPMTSPRSVIRRCSPRRTSRRCSLERFFKSLIPTVFTAKMQPLVATLSNRVHSPSPLFLFPLATPLGSGNVCWPVGNSRAESRLIGQVTRSAFMRTNPCGSIEFDERIGLKSTVGSRVNYQEMRLFGRAARSLF
jgi:hypothetical protein